jgi:Lsr2
MPFRACSVSSENVVARKVAHVVQKTQVVLFDDIDGGEADETVTFALDGVAYEIDLTAAHAAELREAVAPWIGHGRRQATRGGGATRTTTTRRGGDRAQLAKIREWAKESGFKISERGRIPGNVLEAYEAAH